MLKISKDGFGSEAADRAPAGDLRKTASF